MVTCEFLQQRPLKNLNFNVEEPMDKTSAEVLRSNFKIVSVVTGIMILLMAFFAPSAITESLLPESISLSQSLIIGVGAAIAFSYLSSRFYRDGVMDIPAKTITLVAQSLLEEVFFRFNLVMITKALGLGFIEILLISVVQAFFFMLAHRGNKGFKQFLFGFLWFWLAYYFGILPPMFGHVGSNLGLRAKIRKEQGWLYDEE